MNNGIQMFTKDSVCEVKRLRGGSLLVQCRCFPRLNFCKMNKILCIQVKVTAISPLILRYESSLLMPPICLREGQFGKPKAEDCHCREKCND